MKKIRRRQGFAPQRVITYYLTELTLEFVVNFGNNLFLKVVTVSAVFIKLIVASTFFYHNLRSIQHRKHVYGPDKLSGGMFCAGKNICTVQSM